MQSNLVPIQIYHRFENLTERSYLPDYKIDCYIVFNKVQNFSLNFRPKFNTRNCEFLFHQSMEIIYATEPSHNDCNDYMGSRWCDEREQLPHNPDYKVRLSS